MRRLFSWIFALLRPTRSWRNELTPTQHRILRRNLRSLLLSKEYLSEQNESAA